MTMPATVALETPAELRPRRPLIALEQVTKV
jgi:hypothetical protein